MSKHNQRTNAAQTASQAAAPTPAVNIEVQHAWRRSATKAALDKLWHAMELDREDGGQPGDEVLEQQRAAWTTFSTQLLGADDL